MSRSNVTLRVPLDDVDDGARHRVQFYEGDMFLSEVVGRFAGAALGAGGAAVIVATSRHRDDIEQQLEAYGLDVALAREQGRYVALDAAETLSTFFVDGGIDERRFRDGVGGAVTRAVARANGQPVRVFGEMVALLWEAGHRAAAIRLEEAWNDFARMVPFSLLCGYPLSGFASETDEEAFAEVCTTHARVVPAESYSALKGDDEREREISQLQQKACALATEVAQRKHVEEALRERNDTLQRARGDAETANRAKDEFLAMLGHELRNPLSTVHNAVVTARLDPSRRERALDVARRGTDQLGRLVDDLLDVARITQGRITLRTARLPFASIVERAVESTRGLIEERGHALTVALPSNELQVAADATRMEQVIINLLSNAAKYTNPGGRITVTAEHEGGEAVLRVRDDGMGIVPAVLPRVFELFAQADRALDRAQGGLGIGLTVVKRLVELHGGRVEAHSDGIGKGSEFVVRLPAFVAPRQDAVESASADGVARGCARILLVEDNTDAAESLMMLLELLGHRVRVVHDGPSALEVACANPPDVMLVDIGLPGMDGYEVARQVRQSAALRDVVLVALTGYGRDEDRQCALTAGFDYHLVKPVNPDALQGLVAQLPASPAPPKSPMVH